MFMSHRLRAYAPARHLSVQEPVKTKHRALLDPPHASEGFSLIELLVSLLVFAVTILGFISLQVHSLRTHYDLHLAYLAELYARGGVAYMQASRSPELSGYWLTQISEALPMGKAELITGSLAYQLSVSWQTEQGLQSYYLPFKLHHSVAREEQ